MEEKLIAFDPGNQTGYAVFEINRNITLLAYGSFQFKNNSAVGAIIDLFEKHKPTICVVENQYLSVNFDSAKKIIEKTSAITALAYVFGLTVYRVHPKTWQSNVLKNFGFNIFEKRQKLKDCSKKICKILYEIDSVSSDVADAILIGHYFASKLLIESVLLKQ